MDTAEKKGGFHGKNKYCTEKSNSKVFKGTFMTLESILCDFSSKIRLSSSMSTEK